MRFTLLVMPEGQCLLTTEEPLNPEEAQMVVRLFGEWKEHNPAVLVVGDCRVRLIEGIELEVGMAQKSDKDLVEKDGTMDLSIDKGDVDDAAKGGGLEGEAQDHPTMDAPSAPKSVTGDATPEKRG